MKAPQTACHRNKNWMDQGKNQRIGKVKQSLIDILNDESEGLCLPQPDGKWHIKCDVSDFAAQGAIEQLQLDSAHRPVAFYSRKLQGEPAGTTKDTFTRTKHTGQYDWMPRKKECYATVACLLKIFKAGYGQGITVKTDHSAIVEWHKVDLCTISSPLGRRVPGMSSSVDSIS